jgi:hypothetical protein
MGENQVKYELDLAGMKYISQYKHSTSNSIIDFVVKGAVTWALEVKYHGGQPGTIWHKYYRTIYKMRGWPGNRVLVLAGEPHTKNVVAELEEFAKVFGITVVHVSKLAELIANG